METLIERTDRPHPLVSIGFMRAYVVTMRPYLLFLSGITGLAGLGGLGGASLLAGSQAGQRSDAGEERRQELSASSQPQTCVEGCWRRDQQSRADPGKGSSRPEPQEDSGRRHSEEHE